jgi:hypothetical protein
VIRHFGLHHLFQARAAIPTPQHILKAAQEVIQEIVTASNAIEHMTYGTFHVIQFRNIIPLYKKTTWILLQVAIISEDLQALPPAPFKS